MVEDEIDRVIDDEYKSNDGDEVVVKDIEDENLLDETVPDEKRVTVIAEESQPTPIVINPLTSEGNTSNSTAVDDSNSSRREPEEEYFKLAVLAVKMMHTEIGDAEYIYEIDAHKLF